MDKPLPHELRYSYQLDGKTATKSATMMTFMKTTKDSVNPDTIEVNPLNAAFAIDGGAVVCFDSLVQRMMMNMDITLTNFATQTDQVSALKVDYMPIAFAFEDSLTPVDVLSTNTVADILELTSDATLEDIIPTFNNVDLVGAINHPLSSVTTPNAEVLTDWGLTTNTLHEAITWDKDLMFDAFQYYTNGRKLSSIVGKMRSVVLTKDRPHAKIFWNRSIPKSVKRGNPFMFFGMLTTLEIDGDQLMNSTELTAGGHVQLRTHIRFNEWNQLFNQSRM